MKKKIIFSDLLTCQRYIKKNATQQRNLGILTKTFEDFEKYR